MQKKNFSAQAGLKANKDRLLAILSYLLTMAHIVMTALFWYRYVSGVGVSLLLPIVWTILSVLRIIFDFVTIWMIVPKKE